jgi:short-subunit dehydrogenase
MSRFHRMLGVFTRGRELSNSVVVITGATSGLGRATAHALAEHRARLVLAARDAGALAEVVEECAQRGGVATAVPTDVGDVAAVERLAGVAVTRFGAIDCWINAAAGLVAGPLHASPLEELDRLVATNVRGTLLGSRIALEQFELQGQGTLINVSSVLGLIPNPLVPAYAMSKFAIRGMTLSLRLAYTSHPDIHVCTVLPGPLDTPMFERAANHTGRTLRAVPPACAPERAAAAVVRCVRRPRRQVIVGWVSRSVVAAHRVAPAATEAIAARYAATNLVRREAALPTPGGLFAWSGPTKVSGDWRRGALRRRIGSAVGRATARAS